MFTKTKKVFKAMVKITLATWKIIKKVYKVIKKVLIWTWKFTWVMPTERQITWIIICSLGTYILAPQAFLVIKEYVVPQVHSTQAEFSSKQPQIEPLDPEVGIIGTKAWAMQKWANRFGAKVAWQLEVIMDTKESGWDANAYHCNTNGTVDLSWYQLNTVHLDKASLACLADPVCGTELAMDLYEEQGWCPWYGAKKLGFCK